MNFDQFKDHLAHLRGHDLPAGAGVLAGVVFLFLVFKTGKIVNKLVFLLLAAALFAGAYWWFTHFRS